MVTVEKTASKPLSSCTARSLPQAYNQLPKPLHFDDQGMLRHGKISSKN